MCMTIPPPPPTLNITVPPPDPTRTTREVFASHSSNPACVGCHSKLDPLGFGFENFDNIGKYRTLDNKKPVDATGSISGSDVDGAFNGPVELVQRLGKSQQARECFTQHWYQYSFGQTFSENVSCGVRGAASDFIAGKGSVRDLVTQFVRSDMFISRSTAL
jgi:hypothetical protein